MKRILYMYRLDFIGITLTVICIHIFFGFVLQPGIIVFSDIDFPFNTRNYMDQIIGVWNGRFNTTAMLNTPRLLSILPSYILSAIFGYRGDIFFKVFMFQNIYLSCFTFYLFIKRLLRVYYDPIFNMKRIVIIVAGSLYYGLNPWVIFRIQHIYLLVGYSLFPLVLLQFFKIFDHKFQKVIIDGYQPGSRLHRQNIIDSIILGFVISFSAGAIHYFFYTLLLVIGLLMLLLIKYSYKYRNHGLKYVARIYLSFIKKGLIVVGFVIGFSGFWLFIYVGGIVLGTAASQNNINVLDTYTAFSRNSDMLSVVFMISYWWPMVSLEFLTPFFYMCGGAILGISFIGLNVSIRRNHVVLFLGLLGVIMAVLATGVYYVTFAPWFLRFVNLPIIGSLFRDPNKLVGLLALSLSTSFVFGADVILSGLNKVKYQRLSMYGFVGLVFLLVIGYIFGMQEGYGKYFYSAVEEPDEYKELRDYYLEKERPYSIYLPLAEDMLQLSRTSTPFWNAVEGTTQKATGDVHIYNSPINTLFQYEGNDLAIGYYLRYLQYLMDESRSDDMVHYIEALGSNSLIYHDEYLEQSSRQDDNLQYLVENRDFMKVYQNAIFTVLESDTDLMNLTNQYIYTTKGLEIQEIYQEMEGYHPLKTPTIYGYQEQGNATILERPIKGIIDVDTSLEFLLSLLDAKYFLYPFDWINEGNPYLKWSKTYVTSTDWDWYMTSQNFTNRDFNFDMNGGMAVTFAPNQLDVLPYEKKHIQGNLIMDFDKMLQEELFFVADNKELFEVYANPYNEGNLIQSVHGNISRGDPKDIWQVAKSGYIEAKEGMPYQYNLLISGRFISGLHLKVRFFDKEMEEIGVSYIVSPEENVHFDTMDFIGEVISPKGARWMRMDLLTFQKPETRSYWWIHDINIHELDDYVSPNTIEMNVDFSGQISVDSTNHIYVRVFESPKGGQSTLSIGTQEYTIKTISEHSGFVWKFIGTISSEEYDEEVSLTADYGFNGINTIVIVPEVEVNKVREHIDELALNHHIVTTLEASLKLRGYKQLQSMRTDRALSYGKGIDLYKDMGEFLFEVIKEGTYSISSKLEFPEGKGFVSVRILSNMKHESTKVLYDGVLNESNNEPIILDMEKGHYTLQYDIDSQAKNYASLESMKAFDGKGVFVDQLIEDPYMSDCSECETITMDMMKDVRSLEQLDIYYDATCSCDWYIYSSEYIDVIPGEEWYVTFEAQSENLIKRHAKLIFLDDKREPIGYSFINEVEEDDKWKMNNYEQIIEVPSDVSGMYLQFWTRGDKKQEGHLLIKELTLLRYKDFITLDHTIIKEEGLPIKSNSEQIDILSKGEGAIIYETYYGEHKLINTFMSPNKFYKASNGSNMIKLNGVTAGYVLADNERFKIRSMLTYVYFLGLILFVIVSCWSIYYCFIRRRDSDEKTIGS